MHRRPALALAAALAALGPAACGRGPAAPAAPSPRAGEPAVERLVPGRVETVPASSARRVYRIALRTGQLLDVAVEQLGADVALDLRGPSGDRLLAADSLNAEWGPERLVFVADRDGEYLLGVSRLTAAPGGRSTIRMAVPRAPTAGDHLRAEACASTSAGDAALRVRDPAVRGAALRDYERALAAWRAAGEVGEEAWAEAKVASAWSALYDDRRALPHWQRALALCRARAPADLDAPLENFLGVAYDRLGQIGPARLAYAAALAAARRRGERREEVAATNGLGSLEESAGEPWRAFLLLDEALAGWREFGDRRGEGTTLHNLGNLYTVLGRLPEARGAYEQALALERAEGDRGREAATAMALGWLRFREGDPAAARAELSRALALRRAEGDRRGEGVSLDRLGSLARETGDCSRAAAEYGRALAIARALGDRRSAAHTLSNLGEAQTKGGDPAAGLRSEEEALRLLAGSTEPPAERSERSTEPSAEAYARFRRAAAERALGRLAAARDDMEAGLVRLESIRDRAESAELRMSYVDSVHDEYERLIDLLMDLHGRAPGAGFDRQALAVAERSRARSLLDLVGAARRLGETAPGSAGDRLRRIAAEIRAVEARRRGSGAVGTAVGVAAVAEPAGAPDRTDAASDDAALRRLVAEREKILVELRRARRADGPPPRSLGPDEIRRQLLDPGTLLLVYSLGERRSFVWAVTAAGVESAVLPPRAELEEAALRFHDLAARRGPRGAATEERLTAAALSELLLGPVARSLAGRGIAVVAVIADGALAYVPFAALPMPGGDPSLLLEHRELAVLPSASVLAAVRARAAARRPAPRALAVVADPLLRPLEEAARRSGAGQDLAATLAAAGPEATRSARDLGLAGLAPLPFSGEEARAILALVPAGQSLGATGAAASRELATGGGLSRYRMLHFATHALVHPTAPELSGLVLSLYDRRGRPQPGFLRSYEIADLDLPADLVVLSACQTGLGRGLRGEGLVGLTQSFFEAGATRVVVSLWNVDDRATSRLMERFYRELLIAHRPPAEALRRAQLWLASDPRWSAPYDWAGFELQGDWRPLP